MCPNFGGGYAMNPNLAKQKAAAPPEPEDQADGMTEETDDEGPSGTAASGYSSPDEGPFECSNCVHFDGTSKCNNPTVVSDPEVNGDVDPEGCCSLFRTAGNESQDEEHNEGAGEGQPDEQSAMPGAQMLPT